MKKEKRNEIYTVAKCTIKNCIMYFATNVIIGIMSRNRTQAVHVSCIGEIKNPLKSLVGILKGKGNLRRGRLI